MKVIYPEYTRIFTHCVEQLCRNVHHNETHETHNPARTILSTEDSVNYEAMQRETESPGNSR